MVQKLKLDSLFSRKPIGPDSILQAWLRKIMEKIIGHFRGINQARIHVISLKRNELLAIETEKIYTEHAAYLSEYFFKVSPLLLRAKRNIVVSVVLLNGDICSQIHHVRRDLRKNGPEIKEIFLGCEIAVDPAEVIEDIGGERTVLCGDSNYFISYTGEVPLLAKENISEEILSAWIVPETGYHRYIAQFLF